VCFGGFRLSRLRHVGLLWLVVEIAERWVMAQFRIRLWFIKWRG